MRDFNVLIGGWVERDKELFFGSLTPETEFVNFPVTMRFDQLLSTLGIFKSTSEAGRQGWHKDIPWGFTDITIGKLKNRVTILKVK